MFSLWVQLFNVNLFVKTKFCCHLQCRRWDFSGTAWGVWCRHFLFSDLIVTLNYFFLLHSCREDLWHWVWVSVSLLEMTFLKNACGTHDTHFLHLWNNPSNPFLQHVAWLIFKARNSLYVVIQWNLYNKSVDDFS